MIAAVKNELLIPSGRWIAESPAGRPRGRRLLEILLGLYRVEGQAGGRNPGIGSDGAVMTCSSRRYAALGDTLPLRPELEPARARGD